jgi:hypothetical protein
MADPWESAPAAKKPAAAPAAAAAKAPDPWEASHGGEDLLEMKSTPPREKGGTVDKIGRALNLISGMSRAAIYGNDDDMAQAMTGRGKSSEDYFNEKGTFKGESMKDLMPAAYAAPGFQPPNPSAAKVMGVISDLGTDPATYVGAVGKALEYLPLAGKALATGARLALNPLGELVSFGGKNYYKSAFRAADARAKIWGKVAPSDVLFDHNVVGSDVGVLNKAKDIINETDAERRAIARRAGDAGATVDLVDATQGARNKIAAAKAYPYNLETLQAVEDKMRPYAPGAPVQLTAEERRMLEEYARDAAGNPKGTQLRARANQMAPVSPEEAINHLSTMYDEAGRAFDPAKIKGDLAESIFAQQARDTKKGILDSVKDVLGWRDAAKLEKANQEMAAMLTTKKILTAEAEKSLKNPWLKIDLADPVVAGLGTVAGHGDPVTGLKFLAAKKAAQALGSTTAKTYGGMAGYLAGRYGPLGAYLGEKASSTLRDKPAKEQMPWERMQIDEESL